MILCITNMDELYLKRNMQLEKLLVLNNYMIKAISLKKVNFCWVKKCCNTFYCHCYINLNQKIN